MVVWRTYDEWIEAGLDPKDFVIGKNINQMIEPICKSKLTKEEKDEFKYFDQFIGPGREIYGHRD